jgi:hypothetical protein
VKQAPLHTLECTLPACLVVHIHIYIRKPSRRRLGNAASGYLPWYNIETMCRNIKTLFNFEPPVTEEEIRAASLQFVRKLTGFNKPSKANEAAFLAAVDEVAAVSRHLLTSLHTSAPPRNRDEEAARARLRAAQRFGG